MRSCQVAALMKPTNLLVGKGLSHVGTTPTLPPSFW